MKTLSYQEIGQKIDVVNTAIDEYHVIYEQLGQANQFHPQLLSIFEQLNKKIQILQKSILEVKDLELRNEDKAVHQEWTTDAKDYFESVYEHAGLSKKIQEYFEVDIFGKSNKLQKITEMEQQINELSKVCVTKAEKYNQSIEKVFD